MKELLWQRPSQCKTASAMPCFIAYQMSLYLPRLVFIIQCCMSTCVVFLLVLSNQPLVPAFTRSALSVDFIARSSPKFCFTLSKVARTINMDLCNTNHFIGHWRHSRSCFLQVWQSIAFTFHGSAQPGMCRLCQCPIVGSSWPLTVVRRYSRRACCRMDSSLSCQLSRVLLKAH